QADRYCSNHYSASTHFFRIDCRNGSYRPQSSRTAQSAIVDLCSNNSGRFDNIIDLFASIRWTDNPSSNFIQEPWNRALLALQAKQVTYSSSKKRLTTKNTKSTKIFKK